MGDKVEKPDDLTPLEKQVLERLRNGRPLQIPAKREKPVLDALRRAGYGDEI